MAQHVNRGGRIIPATLVAGGSWYVLEHSGPIILAGQIMPVPGAAAFFLAASGLTIAADSWWLLGEILDWVKARTPTGLRGTAGLAKSLWELKRDLVPRRGWGP